MRMSNPTAIARFTGNHQVSIPKPVRDAIGLALGDFVELTAERGTIVLRPKQLTDKPIPEATPTAAEARALNRVIAADKRGETTSYEQYRSERAARLAGRRRQARPKAAR
jgi:AbrB family looped-hinge helix DNA binding protein